MKDSRPVNLALTKFKFPLTAIISILHRISGFVIFLFVPFFLCFLNKSLTSPHEFAEIQQCLSSGIAKFFTWVMFAALIYHLVAGIRHLLMDAGVGETKCGGYAGAVIVIIISIILFVIAGCLIWM